MKKRITSLLLLPVAIGLTAIGAISCATPAVKKPDVKKPNQTQGTTTSTTKTTKTTKMTKAPKAADVQAKERVYEYDSIAAIDSVGAQRRTP